MDRISEPQAPPRPARGALGDAITATVMAGAIGTALFVRQRTGVGQKVDVSLYQLGTWVLGYDTEAALHFSRMAPQTDRRNANNPLWNYYQTKDGKWVFFGMVQSDPFWPAFCRAMGKPEWEKDPRFDSHVNRMKHNLALIQLISEAFTTRDYAEWDQDFRQHGLIYGPVSTPLDVINDPQALQNNFFTEVETPSGRLRLLRSPINFSETPASVRFCGPELGQHTEEILLGFNYTWDDIAKFKSEGVIM